MPFFKGFFMYTIETSTRVWSILEIIHMLVQEANYENWFYHCHHQPIFGAKAFIWLWFNFLYISYNSAIRHLVLWNLSYGGQQISENLFLAYLSQSRFLARRCFRCLFTSSSADFSIDESESSIENGGVVLNLFKLEYLNSICSRSRLPRKILISWNDSY